MGLKTKLTRKQALEPYVLLRLRADEINRLAYLVEGLSHSGRIEVPQDAPFSQPASRLIHISCISLCWSSATPLSARCRTTGYDFNTPIFWNTS